MPAGSKMGTSGTPERFAASSERHTVGLASQRMIETLQVEARGDLLIVTKSNTEFVAIYVKPEFQPQLMLMRCSPTNDRILQSRACQAANNKARELGWIV